VSGAADGLLMVPLTHLEVDRTSRLLQNELLDGCRPVVLADQSGLDTARSPQHPHGNLHGIGTGGTEGLVPERPGREGDGSPPVYGGTRWPGF
jgi:hypothetical protein